jgi:hypothetical protein
MKRFSSLLVVLLFVVGATATASFLFRAALSSLVSDFQADRLDPQIREERLELEALAERGGGKALAKVASYYRFSSPPGARAERWLRLAAQGGSVGAQLDYAAYLADQGRCAEAAKVVVAASRSEHPSRRDYAGAIAQRTAIYERGEGAICPPYTQAQTAVSKALQADRGAVIFSGMTRQRHGAICGTANDHRFVFLYGGVAVVDGQAVTIPEGCTFDDVEADYCRSSEPAALRCAALTTP